MQAQGDPRDVAEVVNAEGNVLVTLKAAGYA